MRRQAVGENSLPIHKDGIMKSKPFESSLCSVSRVLMGFALIAVVLVLISPITMMLGSESGDDTSSSSFSVTKEVESLRS